LPPAVGERLTQASEAELEAWGDAVLTTSTLAAIFEATHH